MILRLVERRTRPVPVGAWFAAGPRTRLTGLAEPLGRPDWVVDVVLVDDETMAGLNEDFRKVTGVTDVLSFSYLQDTGIGKPDLVRGQGHTFTNLWLDKLSCARENGAAQAVGEVVLAPGFVVDRCREKGWSLEHEIPMLLVHGILHILGWDHRDEGETEAMQAVEEEILAVGGLPHPLHERS